MTDDEEAKRMAELVEKVARALWEGDGSEFKDLWADDLRAYEAQARAAVAVLRPLVLEEAAKVAEAHMNPLDVRFGGDGIEIAAAIRALKEDSSDR